MPVTWDSTARRFRDASGRLVDPADVRSAVRDVSQAAADRLSALTGDMAAGRINLAEWNLQARALLKSAHTAATAAASGGWRQVDSWDYAGRRLRSAYSKLDEAEAAYRAGTISADMLAATVARLGRGANGTFEGQRRRLGTEAGDTEEARFLGSTSHHCGGCLEEAAKGWQPIGTLLPIGDCECHDNCVCSYETRGGPPEPDVPVVVPPPAVPPRAKPKPVPKPKAAPKPRPAPAPRPAPSPRPPAVPPGPTITPDRVAAFQRGSRLEGVSYHASTAAAVADIASGGVDLSHNRRAVYGAGFYAADRPLPEYGDAVAEVAIRLRRPLAGSPAEIDAFFTRKGVIDEGGEARRKAVLDAGYDGLLIDFPGGERWVVVMGSGDQVRVVRP